MYILADIKLNCKLYRNKDDLLFLKKQLILIIKTRTNIVHETAV